MRFYKLLYFSIFLLYTFLVYSNDFSVKKLIYKTKENSFEIPYITSAIKPAIAKTMNNYLQEGLFLVKFTDKNYQSNLVDEFVDGDKTFGWSDMKVNSKIAPRFLMIEIDAEYSAAYPSTQHETYFFDIETGQPFTIPTLFSLNGYLDFLEKYWLKNCSAAIKEAYQCAEMTDDVCNYKCFNFDNFYIGNDSLKLETNTCFPHAMQSCDPDVSRQFSINEVKGYLNNYGKYLLGLSMVKAIVPKQYFFIGDVNGKYKINIALEIKSNNQVNGYYYYETQKKKIKLTGTITNGVLVLKEYINNSYNGIFEIPWKEDLYFLEGIWKNKDNSKNLTTNWQVVYQYDKRSLMNK